MNFTITAQPLFTQPEHAVIVVTTKMEPTEGQPPGNEIILDAEVVPGTFQNIDVQPGQVLTITVYVNAP